MANYSLIINSSFKPFSYQEMLAPVMQATTAHQALEDAYGELDAKASIWDKLANESPDSKARKLYQGYADDLRVQADELAKNGLNPSSRQAMLNMRSRYAKDILPIENAWNRRNEDIKAQKQAMINDPTHVFDVSAANTSLDKYLDNPTLDVMSANHSGALLTKQVADAARNFKKYLTTEGGLRSIGLPFQYVKRLRNGASPEEVMAAILRDPKASPLLTSLVDNVMAGSGIRNWSSMNGDWANNPVYNRLWNQAAQGLYEAIGNVDSKYLTDSYSMQLDLMRKKHAMEQPPPTYPKHTPFNGKPVYSSKERDTENAKIQKFAKYFDILPDGSYKPNAAGRKALGFTHRPETEWFGDGKTRTVTKHVPVDREFHEFMKGLNGGKYVTSYDEKTGKTKFNSTLGPGQVGNMYARHIQANLPTSFDAHQHTVFPIPIPTEQQNQFNQSFRAGAKKKNGNVPYFEVVDYDSKTGKYSKVIETIEGSTNPTDNTTLFSKLNITHKVPSSTGEILYYAEAPNGKSYVLKSTRPNEYEENAAIRLTQEMRAYKLALDKHKVPQMDGNGRPVFDKNGNPVFTNVDSDQFMEAQWAEDILNANDEMNTHMSQLVIPQGVNDMKYNYGLSSNLYNPYLQQLYQMGYGQYPQEGQ